jgi:hypothetical protein
LVAVVLAGADRAQSAPTRGGARRRRRGVALKHAAQETVGIIGGAAVMLLIAAAIEAFWSPLKLAPMVKYGVGISLIVIVMAYFLFAGRTHADR